MAGTRKSMEQIRYILQQTRQGRSIRSIARQLGISRNTVRGYLRASERSGHNLATVEQLDDQALASLFATGPSDQEPDSRHSYLQSRLSFYTQELKKRHVTRQILWEEYRQGHPDGYGYTRFCHHLNEYIGRHDVVAMFEHRAGEKLMVDFAGDTLSYVDRSSGEVISCEVLVCVLPCSGYLYVEAMPSQRQTDFVAGISRTFHFLGGVPQSVLCDNLRSAVKKANRYEPTFTELIEQLSVHYQVTFMATRVRKPRDKASVESSVNIVYRRIYARLRDEVFYSLSELNTSIRQALEDLNNRHFQGKDYSRRDAFLRYEQPCLRGLPAWVFQVKKSVWAKVQKNYHVIVGEDMHQYSVPYRYTGQRAKVTYTADTVEVYYQHQRIALHPRNYRKHGYTTSKEHMPKNHQKVMEQKGWDADYFLGQALRIGPSTHQAIARVLDSRAFPEQTYRACLGVLRLATKYSEARLEKACSLVVTGPKVTYGILSNLLKHNMDQRPDTKQNFKTPVHHNVRGPEYYC